jgi:SAM-dependent methyltransferase
MAHWADSYFGELYLASVDDLLTPGLSALEADVIASLLRLAPGERVLDIACGHGRHARIFAGRGIRVAGVDRSADYLRRARADDEAGRRRGRVAYVRGDFRALPFASARFDAAFSWYASLFLFDDATNEACLAEAARVVRPGGRLLVHHANPMRLAADRRASAERRLPDGSVVEEESVFDPATGVDRCARRVVRPDGAVLAGTAQLRYYMPSEWGRLAGRASLRLLELSSTTGAGPGPRRPPGPEAPDLIAVLEKT